MEQNKTITILQDSQLGDRMFLGVQVFNFAKSNQICPLPPKKLLEDAAASPPPPTSYTALFATKASISSVYFWEKFDLIAWVIFRMEISQNTVTTKTIQEASWILQRLSAGAARIILPFYSA